MRHRAMSRRARTVLIAAAALALAWPVLAAPAGSDSPVAPDAPPASAAPATAAAPDARAAPAVRDAPAASTVPAVPATPVPPASSAVPATPVPPASSAAPAAPASSVAPAAGGAASWEKYRLLTERNIFVRDRRRPSTGRYAPRGPAEPINTDRYLVLTGTVNYGDEFIAFFEDTRAGKTVRARVGKTIGNGTLKAISLRGVEYERSGTVTKIAIGCTLTGSLATLVEKVAAVRPEPPKPAATTGPATASAAAPGAQPVAGQGPPPGAPPEGPPGGPREGQPGAPPDFGPGGPPNGPPPGPPQGPPEFSGAPPSEPQLDPGMAEILERMRQRREQELRQ